MVGWNKGKKAGSYFPAFYQNWSKLQITFEVETQDYQNFYGNQTKQNSETWKHITSEHYFFKTPVRTGFLCFVCGIYTPLFPKIWLGEELHVILEQPMWVFLRPPVSVAGCHPVHHMAFFVHIQLVDWRILYNLRLPKEPQHQYFPYHEIAAGSSARESKKSRGGWNCVINALFFLHMHWVAMATIGLDLVETKMGQRKMGIPVLLNIWLLSALRKNILKHRFCHC